MVYIFVLPNVNPYGIVFTQAIVSIMADVMSLRSDNFRRKLRSVEFKPCLICSIPRDAPDSIINVHCFASFDDSHFVFIG